jgi:hypothetical protein
MQGLILIPDISGFTHFVKGINLELGVSITHELLSEIIDNNPLDLELSEIEGDAILFFKVGRPVPMSEIFAGIKKMYEAFDRKYHALKMLHGLQSDLSLKFILHYGHMDVYHLKGFKKLYGQTIIESHRLLKNASPSPSYLLITEDYITALDNPRIDYFPGKGNFPFRFSEFFSGLREIGYYFFHYPNQGKNAFQYSLQ